MHSCNASFNEETKSSLIYLGNYIKGFKLPLDENTLDTFCNLVLSGKFKKKSGATPAQQ